MSFISQHKLIIIVGVIIIAAAGWYTLSGSAPAAPDLVTTGSNASPADQSLVSTLLALRAVKLDGTVLSNPAFMSLRDFSTDIVPEPVGRENPFAPLQVSASASSTKSAQIFTPPHH